MRRILAGLVILLSVLSVKATHIVGGFLSYTYVADSTYQITLTVYRDCNSTTFFDTPAYVGVYDGLGNLVQTLIVSNVVTANIAPPSNPCLQVTTNVCVQQGVYTFNITLPSATSGYTVAYQRCCRNGSINNINDPGNVGETYVAYIPPTAAYANTSPVFTNYPPIYICLQNPLIFDNSATDADGDVLRYSLCTPFAGANASNPQPVPAGPPPYATVPWAPGYSTDNLLGGVPLAIDSITGILTGTPNQVGQFVVGVCVSEFRNGQFIGSYLRDFQFNVTQCNNPSADIPTSNPNGQGIGTFVTNCDNKTVAFTNASYNPPPTTTPLSYQWDFGVTGITTDTSSLTNPTYVYPDTGTYLVRLIATKGNSTTCADTTYAFVKIYPVLQAAFATMDTCLNLPVGFTDNSVSTLSPVNSWSWNFGDGNTSTTQNPTHTYAKPGNYTVTLIDGNAKGCADTSMHVVHIYRTSKDTIGVGAPDCAGSPVSFSTNGLNTYAWNFANQGAANQQNPTFTFPSAGNYLVSVISNAVNGCSDSVSRLVTIHPLPNVTVSPVDTSICPPAQVQFLATGGISYLWSPVTGLNNPNIANPVLSATSTVNGTYTVSVTDQNQCVGKGSIKVNTSAAGHVVAGPDTILCFTGNNNLLVNLYVTKGLTYQWSPATGLSATNVSNPVATIPSNGSNHYSYVVTVVDSNHCTGTDSAVLNLYPAASIDAGPDALICSSNDQPGSAQLQASGGVSYQWSPPSGLSSTIVSNPYTSPTNTTEYYVVGTDSNGCKGLDSVKVTIAPQPEATISPDTTSNCSQGVQIMATGGTRYVWTPASGLSCTDCANPTATPGSTTKYFVSVIDSFTGCSVTDSITVSVSGLAITPWFTDTTITLGDTIQLGVNVDGNGEYNYTWLPVDFLDSSKQADPLAFPLQDIVYTVIVTSGFCLDSADVNVHVKQPDTILVRIPSAFTPNGDGINNTFYPLISQGLGRMKELRIYNRYGQMIHNSSEPWDGRFKGTDQPIGTYVYYMVVSITGKKDMPFQGSVTLLR